MFQRRSAFLKGEEDASSAIVETFLGVGPLPAETAGLSRIIITHKRTEGSSRREGSIEGPARLRCSRSSHVSGQVDDGTYVHGRKSRPSWVQLTAIFRALRRTSESLTTQSC